MQTNQIWEKEGVIIRSAKKEDAQAYYKQNYCPLNQELVRLTGCKAEFTQEEVERFVCSSVEDKDRYLFFIVAPNGNIIGETVINEIDTDLRCANFRIAMYQTSQQGKGIGTWAVETIRDFAFQELKLHRLELDVYSFNHHAEKCCLKAGFK